MRALTLFLLFIPIATLAQQPETPRERAARWNKHCASQPQNARPDCQIQAQYDLKRYQSEYSIYQQQNAAVRADETRKRKQRADEVARRANESHQRRKDELRNLEIQNRAAAEREGRSRK